MKTASFSFAIAQVSGLAVALITALGGELLHAQSIFTQRP